MTSTTIDTQQYITELQNMLPQLQDLLRNPPAAFDQAGISHIQDAISLVTTLTSSSSEIDVKNALMPVSAVYIVVIQYILEPANMFSKYTFVTADQTQAINTAITNALVIRVDISNLSIDALMPLIRKYQSCITELTQSLIPYLQFPQQVLAQMAPNVQLTTQQIATVTDIAQQAKQLSSSSTPGEVNRICSLIYSVYLQVSSKQQYITELQNMLPQLQDLLSGTPVGATESEISLIQNAISLATALTSSSSEIDIKNVSMKMCEAYKPVIQHILEAVKDMPKYTFVTADQTQAMNTAITNAQAIPADIANLALIALIQLTKQYQSCITELTQSMIPYLQVPQQLLAQWIPNVQLTTQQMTTATNIAQQAKQLSSSSTPGEVNRIYSLLCTLSIEVRFGGSTTNSSFGGLSTTMWIGIAVAVVGIGGAIWYFTSDSKKSEIQETTYIKTKGKKTYYTPSNNF